jgi:hypothetical protein
VGNILIVIKFCTSGLIVLYGRNVISFMKGHNRFWGQGKGPISFVKGHSRFWRQHKGLSVCVKGRLFPSKLNTDTRKFFIMGGTFLGLVLSLIVSGDDIILIAVPLKIHRLNGDVFHL